MNLTTILERYGEGTVLAFGGAVIGALFGFFAQRSRFCLRAAVIEFWHRTFGEKLSVWLLAFSTAVLTVQALLLSHNLDISTARQIAIRGSLSGALIGGLLFGAGMILTRGCVSRLLVLSANGNLRALLSGLIFAVTAQASLSGALAPLRSTISNWWTVEGGPSRDLLAITGVGPWGGLIAGLIWMSAALYFSWQTPKRSAWMWIGGIGTGLMVAAAWWFSFIVFTQSFQDIQIQGLTFSGPSAEWLMRVLSSPALYRLQLRVAARSFYRLFSGRLVRTRTETGGLQGWLRYDALHHWRCPDGVWCHARRRLCRGGGHDGRFNLRADRLDNAARHVGRGRRDGPVT